MPFRIDVPTFGGTPDLAFPFVTFRQEPPERESRFFAIVGEAELGLKPHHGVLESAGSVVAYGHLFRQPVNHMMPSGLLDTRLLWGMWFDVGEVVTTSGWDLKVYHLKTNGNLSLLGQLPNIGLRFPGVQVVYPYGGTLGAGGFGAYGSFSPNDTLTLRVEVIDAQGSNVATDSTPTSNSQGFWTAAFSNLPPGGPYQVRAVGNSTASAPSGQFYLA